MPGFVFFGDAGTGEAPQAQVAQQVAAWCSSHPCDFVALLGDNFYEAGVQSVDDPQWQTKFEVPYADLNLPFRAAAGNHDARGNLQAEVDYSGHSSKWSMPALYYHFTDGDSEFFVINTNDFDVTQQRWLRESLSASTASWTFVYGHHPIRSSGEHGNTRPLVVRLFPLLKHFHVTAYLCGHDHNLEVQSGSPHLVVSGGGGAKPRSVSPNANTVFSASTNGFGYIYFEGDTATLTMVGMDGTVLYTENWSR